MNDQVLVCEVLPPSLRATAIGLMNGVNIATGSVGVLLAGYFLRRTSLSAMFAALAVFFLGSAVLTQIGYRRYLRGDLIELAPAV